MTIREVRLFGDPVLNTRADEVTQFDDALKTLVEDMLDTMDEYDGVGLAANQVGVTRRVFVFDCAHENPGMRGHVINPVWEPVPAVVKETERYNSVKVTGQDVDGNPVEITASGLMARCIQHETDHLDGVLFLKRLSPELRKEAMREIRESDWFNA